MAPGGRLSSLILSKKEKRRAHQANNGSSRWRNCKKLPQIAELVEQSRLPLPTGAVLSGGLQSCVVHAVPRASTSCRTAQPFRWWTGLIGSPAILFLSARVEDSSLWLKMLEQGNRCVGAPLLRSDELAKALARY
jgi:hypothetical protein